MSGIRHCALALTVLAAPAAANAAAAQAMSEAALVNALRQGGRILLMRHASSPREAPPQASVNPDNTKSERQLDANGRATAAAMGKAIRELKIPIGAVVSSPTYRARETARLAGFPGPQIQEELGDRGESMQSVAESQSAWLKKRVTEFPTGANTILITHLPNISAAFPQWASDLADGETLVLGPNGAGGVSLMARIKIEQWPAMR